MGKTILKLFTQYSIQQNVRIDMLTADAWSSTVLHVHVLQGPRHLTEQNFRQIVLLDILATRA